VSSHPVPAAEADAVDRSLGLQLISIRLPAAMIEDYKMIAKLRGTLYQPLIREALASWIDEAKTDVLKGLIFDREQAEAERRVSSPAQNSERKP
jgi:hypothetical protein